MALASVVACAGCLPPPDFLRTPAPIVIYVTATPRPVTPAPIPTPTPTFAPVTDTPAATATVAATDTPAPSPAGTPTPVPPLPTDTLVPGPTATPVPPPADTPAPTAAPYDFIVVHQRLWTNEENGGVSQDGTVIGCGYGHEIYVWVKDAAGNPLSGVVIGDPYNNPRHITGEKGPGHAIYDLHFNGYQLYVVEDTNVDRPVTSEVSQLMSAKDYEIPVPWLIAGHYCATEEDCVQRAQSLSLCMGHYSYDIVFQRTW
jgi:hypothetical protein